MSRPAEFQDLVLFVDDSVELLQQYQMIFNNDEFTIATAASADEAIEQLGKHAFSVLVTDLHMPEMDGVALLEQCVQISPHTINVVVSGRREFDLIQSAVNRGDIFAFVTKPFRIDELRLTIKQALKRHEMIRAQDEMIDTIENQYDELHRLNKLLGDTVDERSVEISEVQLELLKREEMKKRFIEIACHELRTPLTFMNLALEMLKDEKDETERASFIQDIENGLGRLRRLTGDILEMNIAERLRSPVELTPVAINDIAREVFLETQSVAKRRSLSYETEFSPDCPVIKADTNRLRNAIQNLVFNSIRFTPDGGTVTIRTRSQSNSVELDVEDTGIGIPESEHARIFEKFFEVKDAKQHSSGDLSFNSSSLGLGLSITKSVMERLGGSIRLTSSPGNGSTFTLVFPK